MRAFLFLLALATACAGRSVHVRDVVEAFAADEVGLVLRAVRSGALDPARAVNREQAMARTLELGRRYLERGGRAQANRRYVSALLACAHLARGETADARDLLEGVDPRREELLSRENRTIGAACHAVGVCRATEARQALEETLEGRMAPGAFVDLYGSFAAIFVPDPEAPGYATIRGRAVERLTRICEGARDSPPRYVNATAELRRLVSEQVYNEAASLLVRIPPPPRDRSGAVERWLAFTAVNAAVAQAYLIPDLLPVELSEEQQIWQRQQLMPFFERAREACDHFLREAERDILPPTSVVADFERREDYVLYLYARLLDAEVACMGWISTR